jgi:hypothetical protein
MEKPHAQPFPIRLPAWRTFAHDLRLDRGQLLSAWRSARTPLLLLAMFGIFMALVQFSTPDLPDNDGFYHIKLAYLMRTEGLKPAFPWLPLSILNLRDFYDHHFLFHVALMPFTFGDLRQGAKWAAVVFAALAFLSTWNLFKNQRIPYASLWALGLLAVSEAFIYRMSITRAQSLSLAVLMLGLDWLLRTKYLRLGFLAFAYVWLYDAFPLLLACTAIYILASWLMDRRLDLRPALYAGIGTILGLIVNPYFPHNIVFAVLHILPKVTGATSLNVGNEWFPYETAQLLDNSLLALAAFLSGVLALGLSGRRMELRTAFGLGLACLFGFMLFQSRRFIEYFPAFSLVFAAFAWTPLFQKESGSAHELDSQPGKRTAWFSTSRLGGLLQGKLPALGLLAVLIPGMYMTLLASRTSLQSSKPYGTYAAATAWLQANTPAGARVFQTDWDDFPRLFFYNTHNTYLIGLDPTYMLLYSAPLYNEWVDITRGKMERPSTAILEDFGAQYILTDLKHTGFMERAAQDPGLVEVYRDGEAVIYQATGAEPQK